MRLIVGLLVLLSARAAAAYPELQLSHGETCIQCHYSPGGGGLLNEHGRDADDELSTWDGDARFLHGAWRPPDGFAFGGDLRLATGIHDHEVATDGFAFPMQGELYVRAGNDPGFSMYGAIGLHGSREHYLMFTDDGSYLRAGRFFPVYGLRTADHTAYVRRGLGMGVLEEPYGVSFGGIHRRWEVHVTGFGTAHDVGLAIYWERRRGGHLAYAAQARVTGSATDQQTWIGGVYKHWLWEQLVLVVAEVDVGIQEFRDGPEMLDVPALYQTVGLAGIRFVGTAGVILGATVQAHDPDLALEGTSRMATQADLQWLFLPYWELHMTAKIEAAGLDLDHPDTLGLLQLHYTL